MRARAPILAVTAVAVTIGGLTPAIAVSQVDASAVKSSSRSATAHIPRLDEGTWSFSGDMTAPARSAASSVTVSLTGTIEVTQGLLNLASCPSNSTVQATPYLVRAGVFTSFSGLSPITTAGSTQVTGSASVAPGTYELVMRYRCGTSSWTGQVAPVTAVSVSTATLVSSENLTLACLAKGVSQCASSSTVLAVPSGYEVRFGAVSKLTWSDGIVTEEQPTGSQQLRYYSYGYWTTENYSTCNTTKTVSSTVRMRCEVGGTAYNEVTVSVVEATNTYQFGSLSLEPSSGLSGTKVVATAPLRRQYTDGSYWPAPTGTAFTLEFQASGSLSWSQLGYSSTTSSEGMIITSFTISQTGRVRLKVSGSASDPADVSLLTRSGKYKVSDVTGPASANPGSSVSISGKVQEELSDGSPTAALDGVSVDLEFAIAYSPSPTADLAWIKVGSGTTTKGQVSASGNAQYSGLWRFRKEDRVSPAVFVSVPGSSPITVAGTMDPISGDVPFVGTNSRFSITATMSGYVGTETLQLFASIGGETWQSIGSITATSQVRGVYSLPNPAQWGEAKAAFQVRDPRGAVVGSGTAPGVFVDGIQSYVPRLTAPARLFLPGETVRFTAALIALTHLDREVPASWSGSAELQRWDGSAWRPVNVVLSARGSQVSLDGEAVAGATYRVNSTFAQAASEGVSLRVTRGAPEVKVGWPDQVKVSQGLRLTAFVQLSEGERWGGTTPVQLQFRAPETSRWIVKSRKTLSNGRTVTMTASRPSSGCYRVILPAYGLASYAGYGVKSCKADA